MLRGPDKHDLIDHALHDEIVLLVSVMLAVANASGPLTQDEIDTALCVCGDGPQAD